MLLPRSDQHFGLFKSRDRVVLCVPGGLSLLAKDLHTFRLLRLWLIQYVNILLMAELLLALCDCLICDDGILTSITF